MGHPHKKKQAGAQHVGHNHRMTTVTSEADLLSCFRELDRHDVELGPDLNLPLEVDGAFAWAVGPRVFLVFSTARRAPARHRLPSSSGGVPDVVSMCEWCHRMRGHGAVRLSASASTIVAARHLPVQRSRLCPHHEGSLMKIREFAARRIF